MKKGVWLVVIGVMGTLVLATLSRDAEAIPAFARKYKTACITCHATFPRLTALGEAFRLNGYKMPGGTPSTPALAMNLPAVWNSGAADMKLKQRIVRMLVQEIVADVDELRGAFEGARVAHLKGAGEIELANLLADRFDDLRPAMAGIDAPQAGRAVEHAAPVIRGVVDALGADQQARRLLVLAICRERHPECFEIVGRKLCAHVRP